LAGNSNIQIFKSLYIGSMIQLMGTVKGLLYFALCNV